MYLYPNCSGEKEQKPSEIAAFEMAPYMLFRTQTRNVLASIYPNRGEISDGAFRTLCDHLFA